MYMTTKEIVQSYERATKKGMQVRILAELNLCSREEIKDILLENGCELSRSRKAKDKTKRK